LEDASEYIGKEHIFKVDVDEKDQSMPVEGRDAVLDMGARQLNRRLQMAPVGSHKVLLLENIERMNGAAANAFLKSLEEPLPGRIIIATSADLERVLPTIQSRAMIFRTQAPSKSSSLAYLSREFPDHDASFLSLLLDYFHGAIGSVISAIQNKDLAIIEHFEQLLAVRNGSNHRQQYSLLRDMYHKA
jgi:DNA polymerase III subunit delta'